MVPEQLNTSPCKACIFFFYVSEIILHKMYVCVCEYGKMYLNLGVDKTWSWTSSFLLIQTNYSWRRFIEIDEQHYWSWTMANVGADEPIPTMSTTTTSSVPCKYGNYCCCLVSCLEWCGHFLSIRCCFICENSLDSAHIYQKQKKKTNTNTTE